MTDFDILRRFIIVTLLTFALVAILVFLAETVFSFDSSTGSGAAIVTILVPAMEAGQTYANRTQQYLAPGRMWRLSIWFVVINLALGVALILISWNFLTLPFSLDILISPVFQISTIVIAVVGILSARYFLGFGQKLYFKNKKD